MKKCLGYFILVISLLGVGVLTYALINITLGNSVEAAQIATIEEVKETKATNIEDSNEIKDSDFVGLWNNDGDTELVINGNGTFEADHYTVSSEITGKYTVKGNEIKFQYNDKTYSGIISKNSDGKTTLEVNLYDENTTLTKIAK